MQDEEVGRDAIAIVKPTSSSSLFASANDSKHTNNKVTCLMAHATKGFASGAGQWIIDSGATNHMSGSKDLVKDLSTSSLSAGYITYGDSSRSMVLGLGKVVISQNVTMEDVMLVETLSYNLLSVAQLADMGFATFFDVGIVVILWSKSLKLAFVGHVKNGLYVIEFSEKFTKAMTCLMAKVDVGWLWHHRLGHVNMRTLKSLHKGNHILGLTDLTFAKDRVCRACIEGKMHELSHPSKTIIPSKRVLELLHMDLFGP
jgi:hypothetical protein